MCESHIKDVIAFCATILLLFPAFSYSYDKEMTIYVDAGKQDCFFQYAKVGDTIEIEYQVIDGGHGDLDIGFELAEPIGRILIADYKKSENVHQHQALIEGDYRICFDNRFSTFNRKTVFFELIVENENDAAASVATNENNKKLQDIFEGYSPEEFYDMKVQDIMDYMSRIHGNLVKARQTQDLLRSFEARDRNIAEENNFKVTAWSIFQIFAMLSVGSLQVFMVKSIFLTDSKLHKVWKKLKL